MSSVIHPARLMSYDDLIAGLAAGKRSGAIKSRHDGQTGLTFYSYTKNCTYDAMWDRYSLVARGLILDETAQRIVATPFPKFFNLGEFGRAVPEGPFEATDKLDGSLIIVFCFDGEWRCSTKLDMRSFQSEWARKKLNEFDLSALDRATTYLMEATFPANRIVVKQTEERLSLIGAYAGDGRELDYAELLDVEAKTAIPVVRRVQFDSFSELVAHTLTLPASAEGFVARWADGTRLKLKGAEYRRIHALISGCTPLGLFNLIAAGDDLDEVRHAVPEEFWWDFDEIRSMLEKRIADVRQRVEQMVADVAHLSDKEVGLSLKDYPADIRGFLFPYRKNGWEKTREIVLKLIRPDGNSLPGYKPSYKLSQFVHEAA